MNVNGAFIKIEVVLFGVGHSLTWFSIRMLEKWCRVDEITRFRSGFRFAEVADTNNQRGLQHILSSGVDT